MDVKVRFLGGARSVTGSRYLIDIDNFRFLFDCGLFQGLKELRLRNWDEFPVDPASIHAVIISHAHIDHTGYLPRLVREGFKGPVYCTAPTADLMDIMLVDSARLQQEEAEFAKRKGYSKHQDPQPLYTEQDARAAMSMFRTIGYNETTVIHDRVRIVFRDAGHLLGSAITEVIITGDRETKRIVFSGDLGRYSQVMLHTPTVVNQADVLFVESTYGATNNPFDDPEDDLTRIVNETFARGGLLVIPAFAVGRTQGILFYLRKLMKEDKIPDVPVYIDSPMAISATYLFYKYPDYHIMPANKGELDREIETDLLVFVKSGQHSKSLNELKTNAIIISSSGMMTGGRILHHMVHRLPNENDTFLVVGYQAEGTRGRRILDGEPTIRIFGHDIPVRAKVETIKSLSGHADHDELFRWLSNFKSKPKVTFCVHGEGKGLNTYAAEIHERLGWNVVVPEYLESVELFTGI